MLGLFAGLKGYAIIGALALAAIGGAYVWGRVDGREIGRVEGLETSVNALRNRNANDDEIMRLDSPRAICRELLSGMPDLSSCDAM